MEKDISKFRVNLYFPKFLVDYYDNKANEMGVSRNVVMQLALIESMNKEIAMENLQKMNEMYKEMKSNPMLKLMEPDEMKAIIENMKQIIKTED